MEEEINAPSHSGSVMLDIGFGVGALVIYTRAERAGEEIEISPLGDGTRRTHVLVRQRQVQPRPLYAAVFPTLPVGDYTIWDANSGKDAVATVSAGSVTEVQLV